MISMELCGTIIIVLLTVLTDCSPVGVVQDTGYVIDNEGRRLERSTESEGKLMSDPEYYPADKSLEKRSLSGIINGLTGRLPNKGRFARSTYPNKDMSDWNGSTLTDDDLGKLINALNTIRDYLVKQKQAIVEDGRGLLPPGWNQKRMDETIGDGISLDVNSRTQPRRRKGPEFNPTGW